MTKEREALKLALEALEVVEPHTFPDSDAELFSRSAITACREALVQQQEPVAYGMWDTMLGKENRMMMVRLDKGQDGCTVPLYTTPPQPEQEPYAWGDAGSNRCSRNFRPDWIGPIPLYTTPPQPKPVIDKSAAIRIATSLGWEPKRKPLTEGQLIDIGMQMFGDSKSPGSDPTIKQFNKIARAIEAAHGIKE